MDATRREFDIILWGATGFTGQLVAEYLLERYGVDGSFRWALAGRNERKLDGVRDALRAAELPLVLGDADDAASMDALANRARVVCTTVGPYAKYGSNLVAACAKAGTHYCDLTGEVHWIRRMIDAHAHEARESGAHIVPTCGFDSIPSDLGVFYTQREMRSRDGAPSPHVKGGAAGFSGGFSGGTIASMLNMLEEASSDTSIRRILANPYGLNPADHPNGPASPDPTLPGWDDDFEQWTAPFVMAAINTRVVRRSNALLDDAYGRDFRYDEFTLTGDGVSGAARAAGLAAGMGLGMGAMTIGPIRRVIASRLPEPGEGPSREEQEKGYWDMRFHAASPRGGDAPALRTRLTGDRDPGYGSTSKMLGEAAVCLALDAPAVDGGFHTPASAFGDLLIERLQKHAGVTFEVLT